MCVCFTIRDTGAEAAGSVLFSLNVCCSGWSGAFDGRNLQILGLFKGISDMSVSVCVLCAVMPRRRPSLVLKEKNAKSEYDFFKR